MLAESSDLVGESNLDGVIEVRNVLHHLRHANGRLKRGRGDILIKLAQWSQMGGTSCTQNRVWRLEKVAYSASFAHELGIVANREIRTMLLAARAFDRRNH